MENDKSLTAKEENKFMEFMSEGRYKIYHNMFKVLFMTDMRSGEMRALTWEDIDFDNKIIQIDKTIHYDYLDAGNEFFITPPKTRSSIRMIPMLPEVEKALNNQKWLQKKPC